MQSSSPGMGMFMRMRNWLQFVSEPGEGSVFSLMTPAQVDTSAEAPAADKENE